jgi:hypothetical protein
LRLARQGAGWRSAHWEDDRERGTALSLVDGRRLFELGNHALLSICLLRNSLFCLLERPAAEIERYVLGLSGELRRRLEGAGIAVLGPPGKEARSGNVTSRSRTRRNGARGWPRGGSSAGTAIGGCGSQRTCSTTRVTLINRCRQYLSSQNSADSMVGKNI